MIGRGPRQGTLARRRALKLCGRTWCQLIGDNMGSGSIGQSMAGDGEREDVIGNNTRHHVGQKRSH